MVSPSLVYNASNSNFLSDGESFFWYRKDQKSPAFALLAEGLRYEHDILSSSNPVTIFYAGMRLFASAFRFSDGKLELYSSKDEKISSYWY